MRTYTTIIPTLCFIVLLALVPVVRAQITDEAGSAIATPPAGAVSCFDYYQFGSVQANLTASVSGTVSGAPIAFNGSLINNNPYPVVDGSLYVKIFRSRGDTNDGNGPDVVDQFFVKGDIAIPANGSVPVSFQWQVPSYARSGEYRLATFFTTSRKFNLLGLSFTDDIVGNTVPFRVSGEQTASVTFDKAGVRVSGEPYFFASPPTRVGATEPATITARVRNTGKTAQTATVSFVVYQWDAQLRENAVQEEEQHVNIPAGSSADVSLTVRDTRYPVYLAVGTLTWMDTTSVINVRFVRENVNRTRINFPSIAQFPLKAGEQNTLFSCLHNAGARALVAGGALDLTLMDAEGNVIHEYRYDGDVTSSMMGLASSFTPERDYDYVTLLARLSQDGEFVDEASLTYDCAAIDPTLCSTLSADFFSSLLSSSSLLVIVLVIVVLAGLIWLYRVVMRMPNPDTIPPQNNS